MRSTDRCHAHIAILLTAARATMNSWHACRGLHKPCAQSIFSRMTQVYKGLRGGVQDVAVKVLLCKDEEQLLAFEKVREVSQDSSLN